MHRSARFEKIWNGAVQVADILGTLSIQSDEERTRERAATKGLDGHISILVFSEAVSGLASECTFPVFVFALSMVTHAPRSSTPDGCRPFLPSPPRTLQLFAHSHRPAPA